MSKKPRHYILMLVCLFLLGQASILAGQEQAEVHDLTDRPLDLDSLLEVLKPPQPPPTKLVQTRGNARSLQPNVLKCHAYREQLSRGITVQPAADIAAVEILFDFDSADLSPEASGNLKVIGTALSEPALELCCFRIEGHADAIGSEDYNERLSEQRARSVVEYLSSHFSIDPERILLVGHGETQPIASNDTEEGRRKNRRVQIVNLGYGDSAP